MNTYKTCFEMLETGRKIYPNFIYSNTLQLEDEKMNEKWHVQFWHPSPWRYELVYRGGDYLYVPIGDKKSSERRGGFWANPFLGFNIDPYANNYCFSFVEEEKAKTVQHILSEIIKTYKEKQFSSYIEVNLARCFFDYCDKNDINSLDYLANYSSLLKEKWNFSVNSLNAKMKPYYMIDKNYDIIKYDLKIASEPRIKKYLKQISDLENRIKKIKDKMHLLQAGADEE